MRAALICLALVVDLVVDAASASLHATLRARKRAGLVHRASKLVTRTREAQCVTPGYDPNARDCPSYWTWGSCLTIGSTGAAGETYGEACMRNVKGGNRDCVPCSSGITDATGKCQSVEPNFRYSCLQIGPFSFCPTEAAWKPRYKVVGNVKKLDPRVFGPRGVEIFIQTDDEKSQLPRSSNEEDCFAACSMEVGWHSVDGTTRVCEWSCSGCYIGDRFERDTSRKKYCDGTAPTGQPAGSSNEFWAEDECCSMSAQYLHPTSPCGPWASCINGATTSDCNKGTTTAPSPAQEYMSSDWCLSNSRVGYDAVDLTRTPSNYNKGLSVGSTDECCEARAFYYYALAYAQLSAAYSRRSLPRTDALGSALLQPPTHRLARTTSIALSLW